ncbi:zinc metalloprotease [Pseudomonas syringae]|nr:hypothetical protein [Pseudomonas syringae]
MDDFSSLTIKPLAVAVALLLTGHVYAADTLQNAAPSSETPVDAPVKLKAERVDIQLYEQKIGSSRFESRHLERTESGYTVESGVLHGPGGEQGTLILVKGPERKPDDQLQPRRESDDQLIGLVSQPGQQGVLQVKANGDSTFYFDTQPDFMQPDTVQTDEAQMTERAAVESTENITIDAMVGFTESALAKIDVNPEYFALGQLETANLSLRNSGIGHIQLRLAGIHVYAEDIPVTTEGLSRWQALLTPLRSTYQHDINIGFSTGGDAGGWAYAPGDTSVNLINTSAFKHELGHNVGGSHCNTDGSDNYKFGYNAGNPIRTSLCGNSIFYYSNPDITYQGVKIGDARTANMTRLWREQAGRLAGYSAPYDGLRTVLVRDFAAMFIPTTNPLHKPYFVANDPAIGPTTAEPVLQGLTALTVPLKDANGQVHQVNMEGGCKSQFNTQIPMHSAHGCNLLFEAELALYAERKHNPHLPAGWYNGPLELTFKSPDGDKKILVSISAKF